MNKTKKKILIVSSAVALIAASAAIAQPHGMSGDTNGDGNLTRAELNAALDTRFARADANGDGAIDESERTAMHAHRRARHAEGRGGRGRHGDRMALMDSNEDGVISRDEVTGRALERFDRMDSNSDGEIDAAEREQMRGRHRERHAERGANRPTPDANGDGRVTREEIGSHALERFNQADTNSDSVVSREERQAARAAHRAERHGE